MELLYYNLIKWYNMTNYPFFVKYIIECCLP